MDPAQIEKLAKSLENPKEELELLVLAILDGERDGEVPVSHIKTIAEIFGVTNLGGTNGFTI